MTIRTSGLSNLQPDLTLSATMLKPNQHSKTGSIVMDMDEVDDDNMSRVMASPCKKENMSTSMSNAIVKSKLGSILPEQITTNFLTNTNTKVGLEAGRVGYFVTYKLVQLNIIPT